MKAIDVLVYVGTSFVGSLGAVGFWFHFDVDDRWRLWRIKRQRQHEERVRLREDRQLKHHIELLDEERRREHEREWPQ